MTAPPVEPAWLREPCPCGVDWSDCASPECGRSIRNADDGIDWDARSAEATAYLEAIGEWGAKHGW